MSILKELTTQELRTELEQREQQEREARKPIPLATPNWEYVLLICQKYIDDTYAAGYANEDLKQYIFEAAMEAIYGNKVWAWLNSELA